MTRKPSFKWDAVFATVFAILVVSAATMAIRDSDTTSFKNVVVEQSQAVAARREVPHGTENRPKV